MMTFTAEVVSLDKKRLINHLWKLIPMRENGEDWEAQLLIVSEEISGLGIVLNRESDLNFLVLLSKLEGLTSDLCREDFMLYRSTIFRCINLLTEVLQIDG